LKRKITFSSPDTMAVSTQQLDLETQLAEAKTRIAALEAALAAKEQVDPASECCGFSRKEMAEKLSESMGKTSDELLRAINDAVKELAHKLYYEDSEWDCSCATPEMCRGDCGTDEHFCEWAKEEKEKGVTHRLPVHDFKVAWRGGWGIPRRILEVEEHLKIAQHALATGEGDLRVLQKNVESWEKALQVLRG
jgi:hypothetical protein